jgi:hypothetical protein
MTAPIFFSSDEEINVPKSYELDGFVRRSDRSERKFSQQFLVAK